jgi:endogenous inhibitor of DNA gyrase (YacG/DUF329 family)
MHTINCPQCKTLVIWNKDAKYRPFCSKRCQLIDLGAWFDEKHRIEKDPESENKLN